MNQQTNYSLQRALSDAMTDAIIAARQEGVDPRGAAVSVCVEHGAAFNDSDYWAAYQDADEYLDAGIVDPFQAVSAA